MDEVKKQQLFTQLKDELRITWDNAKTNKEVKRLVDNAESYLNHLLGAEIDYTAPGMTNILFMAFCSYNWNGCMDEFEDAYKKEILRCRAYHEVKADEEKNTETE